MSALDFGVLSPDCEAHLESNELMSQRSDDVFAWIMDNEGHYLFRVTLGVSAFDLVNALRYGRERFTAGCNFGEANTQAAFRRLIGAAEAT